MKFFRNNWQPVGLLGILDKKLSWDELRTPYESLS